MRSILLILIALTACTKQEKVAPPGTDFESLMGKGLPAWEKFMQTPEDFANLAFFKDAFEQNKGLLEEKHGHCKIPKVVHFIWIGPKPFPRDSVENIRTWIAKNPDWTFKFWTDRERPLPHPAMQMAFVKDLQFLKVKRFYIESDNYGEKSDLLRYEILYQEGGVYADHDVKCMRSFTPLNEAYDFYCGMEVPFQTGLSTSVWPTNNLLGSVPGHPLLMSCMNWLEERWDQIERDYPGKDRESTIDRVSHRTFLVLGENFKKVANQMGRHDIAFPAFYFNAPKDEWAIWARHLYEGTWFENESAFEKMGRQRLMYISKKANKILLACSIMTGLNVLGFGILIVLMRRKKVA